MRKIYFSLFAALLFSVNGMAGDVVTFEEIEVNADGYQNDFGDDSCFELGGFTFNSNYFPEWSYWSGFAISNRTETSFVNLTPDQFNSCIGHGVNGSEKYCVVYPQGEEIEVDDPEGEAISGFYITNEAWAVDAILNGDGMTPGGFTTGDWYKVTVIGTHADETTESVEFYLADYRSENEAEHYYLTDWTWVDLTPLGKVTSVTFRLDSSRKNDWGMTTPGYFCMDDFNGVAPVQVDGVVTFEEIAVNEDGYQNDFGEDSCFELGGFTFNSNYFPEWSYWSGFAISNRTETSFVNLTPDQFNSCVGHGVNGSEKYCVVYPQGEEIEVDDPEGKAISGFYITNEAWAVDAILNGDGMTPGGFTTGDWYKVTVIGTHADETTESVEFYLADYRSENEAEHYYLTDWTWVDLTPLGKVTSVTFRLDSSRKNDWGMTTPGYFCMDDFNGVAPVQEDGVVTFEEIAVNEDGYQNDFSEESCFELGGFTFNSNYFPEWSYWSGFAVSNRTETSFVNLTPDQFNSCVGHGVHGSEKYCVVYPQGEEIEVNDPEGKVISGFYVTNEAWAVDAILNGDGMTPGAFTTGDWFKVTVIGTHADETTESVEFYLADYRSENEAEHYYLDYWQWVDLTPLGKVTSVTFRLDSSRKNDWGMTTPGYFCMDDFNGVPDETASIRHHFTAPSTTATSIHTLDGKAISSLQRGINIVRMSDGSVRKVVVK